MIALDKYVASPKNYFSLNTISVDIMRRCSVGVEASVQRMLESNDFQSVREAVSFTDPLQSFQRNQQTIPNLAESSLLELTVTGRGYSHCQQLTILIRQIPRGQTQQETQPPYFKKIFMFGKQLTAFLEILEEFLDSDISNTMRCLHRCVRFLIRFMTSS
jgi:hypothetical protein